MLAFIFIIICQEQSGFQISALNRAQANLEDSNYRLSYRDLLFFDVTQSSFRLGGRFIINESALYDTILGERLAQRYFEYDRSPLTLHVGNFYQTFGQGMVLNSFEDEALRVDWNIDGINGRLNWDRLGINALLGRPRSNNESRPELIAGAELRGKPLPPYELALSYLRFDATNTPEDISFGMPVEERLSLEQKLNIGPIELLLEAGRRFTWGRFDPGAGWVGTENVNGYGIYGSANFGLRGLGILAEYKDYYKFNGESNALPPCSETGKSLNLGNDERGYRTLVQFSPKDFLTLSAGLNQAWAPRNGRQKLVEWSADLRTDLGFAIVTPAYLHTAEQAIESSYPKKAEHRIGLDLIWGPIIVDGEYKFISDSLISGESRSYRNQKIALSYTWTVVTLAGNFQATDKPPDALEQDTRWASVSINLRLNNHNLQLSYGSHRGELECSTGICHWEPAFRGLKVEIESRF
jgi:hypothetical protein